MILGSGCKGGSFGMKSKVFFIDFRATYTQNLFNRLEQLMDAAGLDQVVKPQDLTAVKLHFGETGNIGFIRPVLLKPILEAIKKNGGTPFLTDANTLYSGSRADAPTHIETAIKNGFAYSVAGAPLVIADGLRGKSETPVAINQKHFDTVYIGSEIAHADALVSVAHFKGHELCGFGGTLKNLGMGCASRKGKLAQHSGVAPKVKRKKCTGCGDCISHCSQQAITLVEEKAVIDPKRCIGCGQCILVCQTEAVTIKWDQDIPAFMEKVVEYTAGVLAGKQDKSLFINFISDVSPGCDCLPYSDASIVRNIGVLASHDPVAVDQASVDLVNAEAALAGCCLENNLEPGEDKFKGIYPEVDWTIQLDYAQQLRIGQRSYELLPVKK